MPNRPDHVVPLTPEQVNALLARPYYLRSAGDRRTDADFRRTERAQSGQPPGDEPPDPASSRWPARAGDPGFEARSRRDTALANELYDALRAMREILAAAALPTVAREEGDAAVARFEGALLEFLRRSGS